MSSDHKRKGTTCFHVRAATEQNLAGKNDGITQCLNLMCSAELKESHIIGDIL